MKNIEPSVKLTSFNCPHCGAHAQQFWGTALWDRKKDGETPYVFAKDRLSEIFETIDTDKTFDAAQKENFKEYFESLSTGLPFIHYEDSSTCTHNRVANSWISRCYNCKKIAIWVYDRMIWPTPSSGPVANEDLPDDIRLDFEEASRVLSISPRGAAALLRLCIQKLVIHLGLPGENLNHDIGKLAETGLDIRIKRALDIVRVIGNNAVHPGQIDLRDDRETADELFRLVNLIADVLISQPKHIEGMYEKLPTGARKAIEERDEKKPY